MRTLGNKSLRQDLKVGTFCFIESAERCPEWISYYRAFSNSDVKKVGTSSGEERVFPPALR
jgi:hypothetical protein